MTDHLTEDELADRSSVSPEGIRRLVDLGILQSGDGTFERRDVMRVRVVGQLESMGIEAEALAAALASGHLTLGYLESAGRRHPRSDLTFVEVADEMGVTFSTLERIYMAFGLPRPEGDEPVREEDLEAIKVLGILFAAGLEEQEVIRMGRVWGDSTRRVALLPQHHRGAVPASGSWRQRGVRGSAARGRTSGRTLR